MTQKHVFVVMSNPVEGREEEYNDWYDNQHVPDVLNVPGIVGAKRFKLSTAQRAAPPYPYDYLAIYEIESDDPQSVMDYIKNVRFTEKMPISDALAEKRNSYLFTERS